MNNIINIQQLNVAYSGVDALVKASASVPKASRTAILGPNGAGKSTLVQSVLGINKGKQKSGTIQLFDGLTDKKQLSQKIAYIPQHVQVNQQFPATVLDIVLMGRYPYIQHFLKKPSQVDYTITLQALEKMGLTALKDRQITELSGGQKQRVFIARAIAQDAELFIMDEPLAGVDMTSETIIMNTLKDFQKEGKTSLVIHHDLNTVKQYFDYVIWVNQTVIDCGPIEQVFNQDNYVKTFKTTQSAIHHW